MTNRALKLAFCLAVVLFAVFHFAENTADPDLWGHVLFGQRMLNQSSIDTVEPFSWTAAGHPWINHEVLAEIALGSAHFGLGRLRAPFAEADRWNADLLDCVIFGWSGIGVAGTCSRVVRWPDRRGRNLVWLCGPAADFHGAWLGFRAVDFDGESTPVEKHGPWRCRFCSLCGSIPTEEWWRDLVFWRRPRRKHGSGSRGQKCAVFQPLPRCRIRWFSGCGWALGCRSGRCG